MRDLNITQKDVDVERQTDTETGRPVEKSMPTSKT